MKIQSGPTLTGQPSGMRPANLADARTAYHQAKEKFEASSEGQLDSLDSYDKWGNRAAVVGTIGAFVGAGMLVARYAPGLDGYGAGFPVAIAGLGTGAAIMFATRKLMENSLSKTDFLSDRTELVEARDQYRQALLQDLNDQGVNDITTPRWEGLKKNEDLSSVIPTRADRGLNDQVDDLELLSDKRKVQGWQGKLAQLQDDPTEFETEFKLVESHAGLLQAMEAGHGQS